MVAVETAAEVSGQPGGYVEVRKPRARALLTSLLPLPLAHQVAYCIIAALIAQRAAPQRAMDTAVWLHGAAADACVAAGVGPVGLTAGETIDAARRLMNIS